MRVGTHGSVSGRTEAALVTAALVALLVLRLAYVAWAPVPAPTHDAAGYDAAARRLLETGSYAYPLLPFDPSDRVGPTQYAAFLQRPANAYVMPGYPAVLAGLYATTGTGPERFAAARILQALLGTATALLAYLIARGIGGRREAAVTLALLAVCPPAFASGEVVLTEPLFAFLLVAAGLACVAAFRTALPSWFAAAGVLAALAVYVRPAFALWPVLLLAAVGWRWRRTPRQAVVRGAAFALAVVLMLAPWWVRNAGIYGSFVPLTTAGSGAALGSMSDSYLERLVPRTPYPSGLAGDDRALGRWWSEQASERLATLVRERPGDLVASRARGLWRALTAEWPDGARPEPLAGVYPPLSRAWLALVHGLALVAVAAGRRRAGILLVASVPLYFIAVHLMTLVLNRYLYPQLPFEAVLASFAAVAGYDVVRARFTARAARVPTPSGA